MKRVGLFTILLAVYANLLLAIRPGAEIDATFTPFQLLSVVALFIIWALSLLGWAAGLRKLLRIESLGWPVSLAISMVIHSLLVAFLGSLGFIGLGSSPFFIFMVGAGLSLVSFLFKKDNLQSYIAPVFNYYRSRTSPWLQWILLSALIATLVDAGIRTLIPWGNTDPLFYQLLAPRLWFERGKIYFPAGAPLTFMASYWEYLHIWALELISGSPGRGLIEVQFFAQLTHFMGYLACGLVIERVCRVNFKARPETTLLALVCVASMRSMLKYSHFAKNDWGGAFWILAGCSLLFIFNPMRQGDENSRYQNLKSILVAGVLLGAGAAAKFTNLPFIAIIVAFSFLSEVFSRKKELLRILIEILGFGAVFMTTSLPYFLRNYGITGDPLFPFFTRVFKPRIPITQEFEIFTGSYENPHFHLTLGSLLKFLYFIFKFDVASALIPITLILGLIFWKSRAPGYAILAAATASICLFLTQGPLTEMRHFGAPLILFSAFAPLSLEHYLNFAENKWAQIKKFRLRVVTHLSLLAAALYLSGGIFTEGTEFERNLPEFIEYWLEAPPPNLYLVLRQEAGIMKAWLRANAAPNTRVVISGDDQFYYLPHLQPTSYELSAEVPLEARATSTHEENMEQTLRALSQAGFRYLGDASVRGFPSALSLLLAGYLKDRSCLIAFQRPHEIIVDLQKVSSLKDGKCP